MVSQTMVNKIAFQSIGGVEGVYLPSQENSKYGILQTNYGFFPTETSQQVRRTFSRFAGHKISETNNQTRLKFITWLKGIDESPFYSFDLRSIQNDFPYWIEGENWFYLQGIVAERTTEVVSLKMQRNYWQNYTEEMIVNSINYLKIKNCPSNIRTSQFWKFTVSFRDGFLHCLSSERLADAASTKKLIKSWQTDPIHSSKSKELLKR